MAHSDHFSDQLLASLAEQIGPLLDGAAMERPHPRLPLELRESFVIWMLGLDALTYGASQELSVARVARRLGRYHHQITEGGRAFAFARSTIAAREPGRARLEELFVSPLAQRIDRAIEWIDQNTRGNDPLVRLLTIPSCYLHAMWLVYPDEQSRVLIVDVAGAPWGSFPNILNGLRAEELHTDAAFLRALAKTTPASGVLLGGRALPGRP